MRENCDEYCNLAQYRFVVLSRQRIDPVKDEQWYQFSCMNRGALSISIGKDSDTELEESAMSVTSDDEGAKQAYNTGVIIKPIAGGCRYELRQDV